MNKYQREINEFFASLKTVTSAKFDEIESLKSINENFAEILLKLNDYNIDRKNPNPLTEIKIIDNVQFMDFMAISQKTAQQWRDNGVISYSQIGKKIYYKISDIKELLENNHKKSSKTK